VVNPYTSSSTRQLLSLDVNQPLLAHINENEVGPILFDPLSIESNLDSRYFIFHDADLGANASFKLGITEYTRDLITYPISRVAESLTFSPYATLLRGYTPLPDFVINSKSSLNVLKHKPLDFELLNLNPFIDPITGIGSKAVKFNVNYF
jgi:hypothetical protein